MRSGVKGAGFAALMGSAAVLALALSGCDGGSASAPARDHAASGGGRSQATASYSGGYSSGQSDSGLPTVDPRKEPVKLVQGKPMWAANRRHTADENAQYHFERDGADFGASNVDDYVAKAHAFVDKPPKDVVTLVRSNGDKLMYDAKGNIFAVVSREGAPRTMFKPRDGAAYWDQQKQRESDRANGSDSSGRGSRYSRSSGRGSSDDQG
jgi:pyocin large subunit-like protein